MVSTWFLDIEDEVKDANIVLASQSPNRLALLKNIGITPRVVVSGFEENLPKTLSPPRFVEETAYGKAVAVADLLDQKQDTYDVIIACDTVIVFENEIIGKPRDEADALSILHRLNNQWHSVFSGVTLIDSKRNIEKFHVETQVKFGDIPPQMIEGYVKSGECFNKAGAYGIQTKASTFVESIHGCYFNIVGLPVYQVVKSLKRFLEADKVLDTFDLTLSSNGINEYEAVAAPESPSLWDNFDDPAAFVYDGDDCKNVWGDTYDFDNNCWNEDSNAFTTSTPVKTVPPPAYAEPLKPAPPSFASAEPFKTEPLSLSSAVTGPQYRTTFARATGKFGHADLQQTFHLPHVEQPRNENPASYRCKQPDW